MTTTRTRQLTEADYATLAEFRHAMRQFAAFSEGKAKTAGLTPQQHQALLAIKGRLPSAATSIGDIAAHLLIQHHSAVELVNRMVDAGLVERVSDPTDGRKALVSTTKRADGLLRELSSTHLEELRAMRPNLIALLNRL